jgi:hypothetical protein
VSRVLKGTIHVPNDDGSITSILGGTSEADAKKQAPDASKSWGDHVWADDAEAKPHIPFAGDIDDDAGDEADAGSSSHRSRRRGRGDSDAGQE